MAPQTGPELPILCGSHYGWVNGLTRGIHPTSCSLRREMCRPLRQAMLEPAFLKDEACHCFTPSFAGDDKGAKGACSGKAALILRTLDVGAVFRRHHDPGARDDVGWHRGPQAV